MSVDHQRLNLTYRKDIWVCFLNAFVMLTAASDALQAKSIAFSSRA